VIDHGQFQELIQDKHNLLVYHFGVYWQSLPKLLEQAKARVWVRYHNVTPPHFFAGWDEASYHATAAGQSQAQWLAKQPKVELFVSASRFNMIELAELTKGNEPKNCVIAPMVQLLSHAADQDEPNAMPGFDPEAINLLFVGRVVPNKAHKHLLGTLEAYRALFPKQRIQLNIVGSSHPNFNSYREFLDKLAERTSILVNVTFRGKASSAVLKNLYRQSTVFLCMSEHEGFCVPLVEAQYAELPVIALSRAAISDTLGPNQLLLEGKVDYDHSACLIHEVARNPDLKRHVVMHGHKNASRFSQQNLSEQWTQLVRQNN
jgi:glycosyltransferase involved in cell wall biosynthesis